MCLACRPFWDVVTRSSKSTGMIHIRKVSKEEVEALNWTNMATERVERLRQSVMAYPLHQGGSAKSVGGGRWVVGGASGCFDS